MNNTKKQRICWDTYSVRGLLSPAAYNWSHHLSFRDITGDKYRLTDTRAVDYKQQFYVVE